MAQNVGSRGSAEGTLLYVALKSTITFIIIFKVMYWFRTFFHSGPT